MSDEIDIETFDEKIDDFFSSNNNELLSYENLDDFLTALDLIDQWNTEEEKDAIWQSFMKYGKDDKVDVEGAKKGMHDFLIFLGQGEEESNNDNNKEVKENKEERFLTRISIRDLNNVNSFNKLVLNKYKQKALEEYECLDEKTLYQLKKIFNLLNIDENNKNIIPVERIEQIVSKIKHIKLDLNDVVKYIHFLSCEDKPIEEVTTININNTILTAINSAIEEKLSGVDLEQFEESEEDEGEVEAPLDILEEILEKMEANKENALALKEMNDNIIKMNQNFSETFTKIIQDSNDENKNEYINHIEEMGIDIKEKIEKFDEYFDEIKKEQKNNVKKIHSLKKSIIVFNNEMTRLKEDFADLQEKYNNNQELDLKEETEKIYDEMQIVKEELENKKEEISELINERGQKEKQINDLYIQLEESQKKEIDFKAQITELKLAAAKSKEEYDNLMDNVLNKMQKKENEEIMERNRMKEMLEKQLENEKTDGNKNLNEKFDFKALTDIDNMNISLTDKLIKKKKILCQLNNDQLLEYTLKLERLNINLKSEKNKKDQKIKELEEKLNISNKDLSNSKKEVGGLNIEIKKLKKKIGDLQKEVKTNEVFRPSILINNQRTSKLDFNKPGNNPLKFKGPKVENKIKNSSDYFKNMSINIGGKKATTTKLKDTNNNKELNKDKNNNISPHNIMKDMYGVDEKNEKESPRKKSSEHMDDINKKNNFEISKSDENHIDGQTDAFNNLEQNGMEFNFHNEINLPNEEGGEIIVDNINDINLGGSNKDLFEIKEEENMDENEDKDDKTNTQNQPISSFFEKKLDEDNIEIAAEKKEDNGGERDTIQVKNNQMAFGGLEDMMFMGIDNNEEEEQEENNLGRISDDNNKIKNENQLSNFGFDIKNKKRKKSGHDNNIKSSGDIMENLYSKNLLEEVTKNDGDNLEINNENKININNEEQKKNNNLSISSNKIQMAKTIKQKDLEISENEINIINDSKDKEKEKDKDKQNLEISKSNNMKVDNSKNQILSQNKNTIQISSQNNTSIKSNSNSNIQFSVQHSSNIIFEEKNKRKSTKTRKAEIENNNYDYYSLFHEDFVLRKLNELKDKANEKNIYSDQIYLLTNGRKLEKRLILLTPSHIFIIEPKEAQFVLIMQKSELNKIAISNQNLNILILLRKKAESVIILTLRRMDLLNFIKRYYHESQNPIRFTYEDSFKMRIKGKETLLSVKDKIFTTLSNFDGAIKIGYLQKMSTLIFKTFSEKLVVLTSIGLIVFGDPNKPPERLYPIIGSRITKALGTKYKRPNCFEILTPNGETKVFSAYKERDLISWMEEFDRVKKEFSNRMKKLDTVNKIEFIDNKNELFGVQEEEDEDEEEKVNNKK